MKQVSNLLWGVRKDYHFSCEDEITSKVLEATRLKTTLKLMKMERMDLLTVWRDYIMPHSRNAMSHRGFELRIAYSFEFFLNF